MTSNPTPPASVDVAEGRRLLESATPGPWRWSDWRNVPSAQSLTSETKQTIEATREPAHEGDFDKVRIVSFEDADFEPQDHHNAALIIFAVNNLPALLTAAEQVASLRRALEDTRNWIAGLDPKHVSTSTILFQIDSALGAAP